MSLRGRQEWVRKSTTGHDETVSLVFKVLRKRAKILSKRVTPIVYFRKICLEAVLRMHYKG